MQKKLIALAVASLASGAAVAQTNVTMYGIVDAGYVYSTGDAGKVNAAGFPVAPGAANIPGTNTFSGVSSGLLSGSRLGFRGEEALGNGLKAIFTLEYGLSVDDNSGVGNTVNDKGVAQGWQARQQFVGLSGGFGAITLGRQYSPGYQATANNDPAAGAAFEPQSYLSAQASNTITPNSAARWNNALAYTTPNWGGFTGKLIYSFGETNNQKAVIPGAGTVPAGTYNDKVVSWDDNGRYALGANYANGPLNIDFVYQVRQNVVYNPAPWISGGFLPDGGEKPAAGTTPASPLAAGSAAPSDAAGKDINEGYLGGSFDFKVVKIMASYQQQNDKNPANNDNTLWQVGGIIPVGNGNIHLGYASLEMDQGKVKAPYAPVGAKKLNGNSDAWMLAYTHSLSKRTTLYAGYVWTENDKNSINAGPVQGVAAKGEDNQTFLAGVRHSF